ncbi:erythromycin biosynthesis sensory transduction protein eryC1 [candidate division WOR-3 bacterium JGI_Cruoil_03_44_89]|uniref:Erythromycin biosynthesis sensory transduction protein eryC1 n=1 Tax=candidate division WOR-3 bacterium JGI_Cruoil_03_44_89 TaxID=1973748 RepID=A0A235BMD0_UNCW3|nr:MAG: erythromycin biosynthesis sensory transduction protein eryC1 [candidate division WOR-3 bacterium JGI_Cruoil_03_44_89]
MIKLIDLGAEYGRIKSEIDEGIREIVEAQQFTDGGHIGRFEEEFSKYLGVKNCVGVSSGSTALDLALLALGIGEGDEVIVPSFTFIATAEAVSHVGAIPVFADSDYDTQNIDVDKLKPLLTGKTKAIIPVHLYGNPCDMDGLMDFAREYELKVVEDAAQAQGAVYNGRKVSTIGDVGCFSFYPAKNLGAYGHAGAAVTDDDELAEKIRLLSNHGRRTHYAYKMVGYNYRMDSIQAKVLSIKLTHLKEWNERRRKLADIYTESLKDLPMGLPKRDDDKIPVYHLYIIRTDRREKLVEWLKERGIETRIHYPLPLHLQPAYGHLGYVEGDLPVSERLAREVLSLPLHPYLEEDKVHTVIESVREFFS